MTSVLLTDDHGLIRRGLHDALADEGLVVAGEAGGWSELEPLLDSVRFDVLILDVNLPGPSGLDILELLSQRPNPPRTLMLSMYPEDPYALRALAGGACGYVNKSAPTRLLAQAIRQVAAGGQWVSEPIARLRALAAAGPAGSLHERLSARERMLLELLAQRLSLAEVAHRLASEPRAVAVWRARLLEKLKLASNAELAQYAALHGLVPAS